MKTETITILERPSLGPALMRLENVREHDPRFDYQNYYKIKDGEDKDELNPEIFVLAACVKAHFGEKRFKQLECVVPTYLPLVGSAVEFNIPKEVARV